MKNLHVFDLDGTLLLGNCSLAFGLFLRKKGLFSLTDQIKALFGSLYLKWQPGCGVKVHETLFRELFQGRPSSKFLTEVPLFLENYLSQDLRQSLLKNLQAIKAQGDEILLLSASPSFLVGAIADRLGITHWRASEYTQDEEGRWQSILFLLDGHKKVSAANEFANNQGFMSEYLTVYSDSLDDLPLLEFAQNRVVIAPDRHLRQIAQNRGWQIIDSL